MNNNMNMSYVDYERKNRKNVFVGFLIFVIFMGGAAAGGYYYGHKQGLEADKEVKTEEVEKKETEASTTKAEEKGISKKDITYISPYILDNALDGANLGVEGEQNIVNNMSKSSNFIENKNFKISLAYVLGYRIDKSKYTEDVAYVDGKEEEATGGVAIKLDDFNELYNKIYGEELNMSSLPSGLDNMFQIANDKLYSGLYSGYSTNVSFEIKESDVEGGSALVQLEQELEDSTINIGTVKVEYKENSNGTINITGLYFTSNQGE